MSRPLYTAYFRDTRHGGNVFGTDPPRYHEREGVERFPSAAAGHAAYVDQEAAALRAKLPAGTRVYCLLNHVSSSGMSRRISLKIVQDGGIADITYAASLVLGDKVSPKGGIVVPGAGMDMGFHLVYCLGAALYPAGTPEPHGTRNGKPDSAGGYALKHEWL